MYGVQHPEYRKAASELAEVQKQFDDTRRSISATKSSWSTARA